MSGVKLVTADCLIEPTGITNKNTLSDLRKKARKYCAENNLPVPEWAQYKVRKKIEEYLVEPKKVTSHWKYEARQAAEKLGVKAPEWAKLIIPIPNSIAKKTNRRSYYDEKIAAVAVMCDCAVAEQTGMQEYWTNAERNAVKVGDPALLNAVRNRTGAYDAAKAKVLMIDPNFGKHVDSHGYIHVAEPKKNVNHSHKKKVTQERAWKNFCKKYKLNEKGQKLK